MLSNEKILHYIWKFRQYHAVSLKSSNEENLEVIHPGTANLDAGPDFYHSKIKIADTLWVGNVEIHLKSSDWFKHQHEKDKAYDNVILHVVWEHDAEVFRSDGTLIPTLSLKNKVSEDLLNRIEDLDTNQNWIACEYKIGEIENYNIRFWLETIQIERLQEKSIYFAHLHEQLKGSWEDTFYVGLARSFGFKVNSLPFELLAKYLPQQILSKHKDRPLQIEALVFGVSGLLQPYLKDNYPKQLIEEFNFLKKKYNLYVLEPFLWKFAKTRPDNFPTIRIAQFAALIIKSVHLFSKIIDATDYKNLKTLFSHLNIHEYWDNHYTFDTESNKNSKKLGDKSIDHLIINTVVPLLFYYGKQMGKDFLVDRAISILLDMKSEKNAIIEKFNSIGLKVNSAFESQALIQMKKNYCDQKKCLNCGIGIKVLNT